MVVAVVAAVAAGPPAVRVKKAARSLSTVQPGVPSLAKPTVTNDVLFIAAAFPAAGKLKKARPSALVVCVSVSTVPSPQYIVAVAVAPPTP